MHVVSTIIDSRHGRSGIPTDDAIPHADVHEALRRSEERFRILVESVRDYAIYLLDPDGVIVSWNVGAERIKGYTAAEVIGQRFTMFYLPEEIGAARQLLDRALALGSAEAEGWRVRRDGSRFWVSAVVTALYDGQGRHIGFAKVTRDLTQQRRRQEEVRRRDELQLAASEQRFATFAQHLPGLAWIKDLEGHYVYINNAAAQAFNRDPEAILGRTDLELFDQATAAEFRVNDARALESWTGVQVVEHLRDHTGVMRHSIVSKFPITDTEGRFHRIGGVAIDITDRVNAETALAESDRRKTEFLATLSHELRNPLAVIRNTLHLLRNADQAPAAADMHGVLDRQLRYLVRLVDDLLEIARISTGKLVLQRRSVDLRDIVTDALEASTLGLGQRRREVTTTLPETPVVVSGDAVRLTQLVANLLNNAAKYTADGGHIDLSLTADEQQARITVRDDGIGIDAGMLQHVFDMFAQADAALQRTEGGLGIGLTLAQNFAMLHGGTIEACSEGEGKGSAFTVRLPRIAEAATAVAPRDRKGTGIAGLRLMLVDDNRDAADSLAMLLNMQGAETRCVYDGATAIEMAGSWRPDVIILDLGMPGIDGYEVARRIRDLADRRPPVLIALSGWGGSADRERTAAAGFEEHWVKPVEPARLTALLSRYR